MSTNTPTPDTMTPALTSVGVPGPGHASSGGS